VPDAPRASDVERAGDGAPQRRPVEATERPPVAVHLDDDARARAREDRRGALVWALRDDRLRAEGPRLARDPAREQRPETRPVERTRRWHKAEALVAVAVAVREHAEVEHLPERLELARAAGGQRQVVPVARDEQDPRLRRCHPAARKRIASSRAYTRSGRRSATEAAAARLSRGCSRSK
jgi:hypothetical protein